VGRWPPEALSSLSAAAAKRLGHLVRRGDGRGVNGEAAEGTAAERKPLNPMTKEPRQRLAL
jgi:hypothetical protein